MGSKLPLYALDGFHKSSPDPLTAGWDSRQKQAMQADAAIELSKIKHDIVGKGKCEWCGEEFDMPRNLANKIRGKKRFCSAKCCSRSNHAKRRKLNHVEESKQMTVTKDMEFILSSAGESPIKGAGIYLVIKLPNNENLTIGGMKELTEVMQKIQDVVLEK